MFKECRWFCAIPSIFSPKIRITYKYKNHTVVFAAKVKVNQELVITMGREVSLRTTPDILETGHQLLEIKDQTLSLAHTVVSAWNFIVLGCQAKRLSSNVLVWLCKGGNLSFCLEIFCAWNQVMNWAELSLGEVISFLLSRSCVRRNAEALWLIATSHTLCSVVPCPYSTPKTSPCVYSSCLHMKYLVIVWCPAITVSHCPYF